MAKEHVMIAYTVWSVVRVHMWRRHTRFIGTSEDLNEASNLLAYCQNQSHALCGAHTLILSQMRLQAAYPRIFQVYSWTTSAPNLLIATYSKRIFFKLSRQLEFKFSTLLRFFEPCDVENYEFQSPDFSICGVDRILEFRFSSVQSSVTFTKNAVCGEK